MFLLTSSFIVNGVDRVLNNELLIINNNFFSYWLFVIDLNYKLPLAAVYDLLNYSVTQKEYYNHVIEENYAHQLTIHCSKYR